ncbi:response regulator [Streptomyces sp. ACA25]|uniref:response regulator n=1 Tax=Streptomyces sp. ACA25 TaxID=3022596 RepID=UPI0023082A5E|nr:response regulator [Streptomyces sp. ACA25]MDB1087611.1 response regulator [Streptomyces sp. ACA25]
MSGTLGRVLVVDDSPAIRQLIRVILEMDGFEVVTAADGAECLEAVQWYRPDVITLDRAMPRLDGPSTARRLRRDPLTRNIPLVLVSAAPGQPVGVDAVVLKPFEPAELVRLVARLRRSGSQYPVRLAKPPAGCPPLSRTLAP